MIRAIRITGYSAILLAAVVAGCGPAPAPPPAGPATYRVSGRVQPEPDVSFGSGVVALLATHGSAQSVLRERTVMAKAISTPSNAWPFLPLQNAIEHVQKARIASAVTTGADGKFEFPDEVLPGDYVVIVGIPIMHDPAVGKPVSRDWPEQLVTKLTFKMLNREVTLPARNAWVLKFTVSNSHRSDVILGGSERMTWPKLRPNEAQLVQIRKQFTQLEPLRKSFDSVEKQFRDADSKARQSGQPLEVRKARTLQEKLKTEQENLDRASEALEQLLTEILNK